MLTRLVRLSRSFQPYVSQVRRYSSAEEDAEVREFLKQFSLVTIPRETCDLSFSRSSGPGSVSFMTREGILIVDSGQNVNKLNTKATLRLPRDKSDWIPEPIHHHLRTSGSQYLTKQGDLVIQSQRSRTQEQNKEDCFRKLTDVILDAGHASVGGETSIETKQKVNRLMKKDNERRIETKKFHSAKKSARRSKGSID